MKSSDRLAMILIAIALMGTLKTGPCWVYDCVLYLAIAILGTRIWMERFPEHWAPPKQTTKETKS